MMRLCSVAVLVAIAAAVSTQTDQEPARGAPIIRRRQDLDAIAAETDTDRLLAKINAASRDTSAAVAADGSSIVQQTSSVCVWSYSCNGNGIRKWGWTGTYCKCNSDWEGSCCDEPKVCKEGMSALCPQKKLQEASANCEGVSGAGPLALGTAAMNLPVSLQGIFWLTKQGDSSSLMSFGTSKDGKGLSQMDLDPRGGNHIEVRVGGDRAWSFADKASSWSLVRWTDLMYEFAFKGASGKAPNNMNDAVEGQITPYAHDLGIRLSWTLPLDFDMKKIPQDKKEKYPNSVVWGRPTSVGTISVPSAYYDLVQVIDGNGAKLEPAYSDWLAYCKDEGAVKQTGKTPGKIWYHRYA